MNLIQQRTRAKLEQREAAPVAFVVHNTGATDIDAILRVYGDDSAESVQPHYFIAATGAVWQIADDMQRARHVGRPKWELQAYALSYPGWSTLVWREGAAGPKSFGAEQARYAWWRATWRDSMQIPAALSSPLDMVTGSYPNATAIGVELQSLTDELRTEAGAMYTGEQYQALAELLTDRAAAWKIPLDRQHVLTHSDVSPLRRTDSYGATDPRGFDFARLWAACGSAPGPRG